MQDVEVIEDPAAAAVALDPIRSRLLAELAEPGSAAALAARVGLPRQKVNYHLRTLEAHGLVEVAEMRSWGGITERVLRATAATYVVSPAALDAEAADPATVADRLSARHLVALGGRLVREVAALARRAAAAERRLPTFALDLEIGFASAEDRAAFADELTAAVAGLAARCHVDDGRPHRLIVAAHPRPAPELEPRAPELHAPESQGGAMTPDVPLRLERAFELPGPPEQVWHAIATADGLTAWFLRTELDEREGGRIEMFMGEGMSSEGIVTAYDAPRRLVYEEPGWAELVGQSSEGVTPLVSEFVIEARSGGTCVLHLVSSAFGSGAEWEREMFDDMARYWFPTFDRLRLYLARFPGQRATTFELARTVDDEQAALCAALRSALGVEAVGQPLEVAGARGWVEQLGSDAVLVDLEGPVPGFVGIGAFPAGAEGRASANVQASLFPAAGDGAGVEQQRAAWQAWLDELPLPATAAASA